MKFKEKIKPVNIIFPQSSIWFLTPSYFPGFTLNEFIRWNKQLSLYYHKIKKQYRRFIPQILRYLYGNKYAVLVILRYKELYALHINTFHSKNYGLWLSTWSGRMDYVTKDRKRLWTATWHSEHFLWLTI